MMLVNFHQGGQYGFGKALAVAPFVQDDGAEVILQLDITPHHRDLFAYAGELLPDYREMGG